MTLPRPGWPRDMLPADLAQVLAVSGLAWTDILGPSHQRHVVAVRHELMGLLRRRGWALERIGVLFERDHKTVLHACRKGCPQSFPLFSS